jgi:Protein of unknown function (DUF2971)
MRSDSLKATTSGREPFLFHYTSLGSAEKIVQSRELWATNIYYLNDGSEFTHGIRLMREYLATVAERSAAAREFRDDVSWTAFESPYLNVFIVSFSETGDLLSQWRSYCPPNRGISLGLPAEALKSAAKRQGFDLVQCSYDLLQQQTVVKDVARRWMRKHKATRTDAARAAVASGFAASFARVAASFKDASFAEEREWRLVRFASEESSGVRYREGSSTLIPYLVYQLPVDAKLRLVLPRIIVGPTPHANLSRRAVVRMLKDKSVGWQVVAPSGTPFRAW